MLPTVSSVPFLLLNIQTPIQSFTHIMKFDIIFRFIDFKHLMMNLPRLSLTLNNFHGPSQWCHLLTPPVPHPIYPESGFLIGSTSGWSGHPAAVALLYQPNPLSLEEIEEVLNGMGKLDENGPSPEYERVRQVYDEFVVPEHQHKKRVTE